MLPVPDCSLGWQSASWIETLLCHGPGDVEGDPVRLDPEFLAVLVRAYAVDPEVGRRLVRRYVLSRAKGRAKSELAAFIVLFEAFGPARFHHWAKRGETSWWGYEFERGEPVGAPVTRPFIRCLATEETQAENTYGAVHFILTSGKARLTEEIRGIDVGLTRTFLPGHAGEIRPSTASSAAKDGGRETFAVFDETHLYVLPELRQMHATVRRNLRKRRAAQPWSLETTTMFEQGAGSVAETTFKALEEGKAPPDVVFDHREGPDPDADFDWDDDDELKAALAEAYGPAAEWMDLDGIVAEIRDPETDKADAIRFFLNRASSSESDVVRASEWTRLEVGDKPAAGLVPVADLSPPVGSGRVDRWWPQPGETITLGFDGSQSRDATAIVGVRASDGLTWKAGLWEPPPGVKGWQVPRAEVHELVEWLFDMFRVVKALCDPRFWETDIDGWAGRWGEKTVLRLPQSDKRLWDASTRFITAVQGALSGGDRAMSEMICHTGDPDLAAHVGNARRRRLGGRLGRDGAWIPEKKKPGRRIDLLSAAMFGHVARAYAIADGLTEPVERDLLAEIW